MHIDQVIGTIIATEGYRRMRYVHATRIALACFAVVLVMLFTVVALASKQDRYLYVLTDLDGTLATSTPLTQPNMDDAAVEAWAAAAITRIYTFDFLNYRSQFQEAQKYLTVYGMQEFLGSLNNSGNFTSIIENKYVLSAAPAGPAQILWKGPIGIETGGARYGWKVELPIVITYRSSKQDISQRLMVRATIGRMPERTTDGSGLGIRQILAQ